MTATAPSPLRVVSFGDLEGHIWGTAIDAGEPAIVFTTPDGTGRASGIEAVRLLVDGRSWRLAGDGFDLLVTPSGEKQPAADTDGDMLCQVTGTLSVPGASRSVHCIGTRSSGDGRGLERLGRLDSVRGLSEWFASDRAVAALSFRPQRGAGQDADLVAATMFEPEGPVAVNDPRLSTTYGNGGRPARANLELWIGEGDDEYPRRTAAEARGDAASVGGDRVKLEVTPLRCHSAGSDGAGVYVLARF